MPKRSTKKLKRQIQNILGVAIGFIRVAEIENDRGNLNSKEGQKYGRKALDYAVAQLELLCECVNKFGCHPDAGRLFDDLKYWQSLTPEERSGLWLKNEPRATLVSCYAPDFYRFYHLYCDVPVDDQRCFINQLLRWVEQLKAQSELSGEALEVPAKPPKEAIIAYKLYNTMASTQDEVANIMSRQLKRKITQGQVSRWIKEVNKFMGGYDLTRPKGVKTAKLVIMDSAKLDLDQRRNGHSAGDPRYKKLSSPEE